MKSPDLFNAPNRFSRVGVLTASGMGIRFVELLHVLNNDIC